VQPGQDGSAAGVEHALPGLGDQAVAQLVDPLADADVGDRPVQQGGSLDQHAAQRLSETRWRTASLSAPNPGAGRDAGGACGGRGGCAETDGSAGSAAEGAAARGIVPWINSPPPRPRESATASAAPTPHSGSAMASPQNTGWSTAVPTSPPATAASSPNAGRLSSYPVMRSQIRPGRGATWSGPRWRRSSAAGREPSITTSAAPSRSRSSSAWPSKSAA